MLKKTQVLLMSLVLLAFAATSIFIFPQADDFSYTSRVFELGFWGAQISEYMKWTGRYSATAFLSLSPMVWGELWQYRMMPIILLLLIFASNVFLMREIFGSRLQKNESWFFGLALTFLTITGFHTISEGIYWLASSYSYTIAIVFFNISFALIWAQEKSNLKYALASISALILTGCNETSMVIWMYALGVTGFFQWQKNQKIPKGLVTVFIVSLLGAIIMLISPGNAIRAGYFEKSHDVIRTVSNALLYSFIDPFKFLTLPLIVYSWINFERIKEILQMEEWRKHRRFILLAMMGLFFISFAPSLWGMGRRPNTRTMNVIVHAYLLIFFPFIVVWVRSRPWENWMRYGVILLIVSMPTFRLVKDYVDGGIFGYGELARVKIKSGGERTFDDAPKTIHFKFIERPAPHFESFIKHRPEFYD